MFFRSSLVLLLLFKLAYSYLDLNLNTGEECTVDEQNGVCKTYYNCEWPCSEKRRTSSAIVYCRWTETTICCPVPAEDLRISAKKCAEYKEKVCDRSVAPSATHLPQMETKTKINKIAKCTFIRKELIANGEEAKIHEFPHMALIGYEDAGNVEWTCGGTLISERFVLTAAHCLRTKNVTYHVQLGAHNKTQNDGVRFTVTRSIPHQNYTSSKHYYDIALLELDRNANLSTNIRPACLPVQPIPNQRALVTGWGRKNDGGPLSDVLLKTTMQHMNQSECNDLYADNEFMLGKGIQEHQVCFESDHRNNTCEGDSGGPLQIYHATEYCSYTVIGITSFNVGCLGNGASSVFTRVFDFLDWIESNVWLNSTST